jgi:signal transduction histidine kinase
MSRSVVATKTRSVGSRELEAEVRGLRAEVEELRGAGRARDEGLTRAAHELSAPLTAMKAYVEALQAHYGEPTFTQGPEFLGVLERETARLIRIVDRSLILSRAGAGCGLRRESVQLGEVASQVAAALRPVLEERAVACDLELPSDLPEVEADRDQMEQVLVNLVHNAVKFSPRGERVALRAAVARGEIMVEVRDRGYGIDPSELGLVFQPFFRSQDLRVARERGTGLGLCIVKTIVERHGGRVGVESEPSQGTRVWFTLPRAAGTTPAGSEPTPKKGEACRSAS